MSNTAQRLRDMAEKLGGKDVELNNLLVIAAIELERRGIAQAWQSINAPQFVTSDRKQADQWKRSGYKLRPLYAGDDDA